MPVLLFVFSSFSSSVLLLVLLVELHIGIRCVVVVLLVEFFGARVLLVFMLVVEISWWCSCCKSCCDNAGAIVLDLLL